MSGARKKTRAAASFCGLSTAIWLLFALLTAIFIFFVVVIASHFSMGETFESHIDFQQSFISNRYSQSKSDRPKLRTEPPLVVPSSPDVDVFHAATLRPASALKYPVMNLDEPISDDLPADGVPYHELRCPHAELVQFWSPPSAFDLQYKSPYFKLFEQERKQTAGERYVTFEPDVGGWNNIRMQMEVVLVFALVTGRTLVLPPAQPMYLLNAGQNKKDKTHGFEDFFPFQILRRRMKVISMEEFLTREALTGRLQYNARALDLQCKACVNSTLIRCDKNRVGEVLRPPQNRAQFDGADRTQRLGLWDYLRLVGAVPRWKSMNDVLVFPADPENPSLTPGDERRTVFLANRTAVVFDTSWQREKVLHFVSKPGEGLRLLEHFYTFLYFEDTTLDRFVKRFVRDAVHYRADILCRGAQIVDALLKEGGGFYVSFHIRRGEFQYKVVKLSADRLVANLSPEIPRNTLVYIASDERNASFFAPLAAHFSSHRLRFLDDFKALAGLEDLNPNYLGMLDQIVCAGGAQFIGTWFSTFSGYITRMRAYQGRFADPTNFYGDKEHRDRFRTEFDAHFPFYMREWPTAWKGIDQE